MIDKTQEMPIECLGDDIYARFTGNAIQVKVSRRNDPTDVVEFSQTTLLEFIRFARKCGMQVEIKNECW